MQVDCSKAIAAGLRFRPVAETVADTLAWDTARPPQERRDAMPADREHALLDALAQYAG